MGWISDLETWAWEYVPGFLGNQISGVGNMERKLRVCSYKISRKRVGAKIGVYNLVRDFRVLCGESRYLLRRYPHYKILG